MILSSKGDVSYCHITKDFEMYVLF